MNRNLNPEEKERLRDKYEGHLFFRLVNQSCKKYEREMKVFRFSPEDVFIETLNVLDDLKAPNRNNDDLCDTLWDDLFCDFRERGENIPEAELDKAVTVVLSMVVDGLVLLDSMRYNGVAGKLNRVLQEHGNDYLGIQLSIDSYVHKIGREEVKQWLAEYMQADTYLSEEVEDSLAEREEEEAPDDNTPKIAPNKVRAQLLLEILKQCGMGLDRQDMTKVARLVGFIVGSSAEKLRQQLSKDGGLILNEKTHRRYVDEVNNLLKEMKSRIKLDCE